MEYLCRRCSDRREVDIPVNCDLGEVRGSCYIKNIGIGGAYMIIDRKVNPGQRGEMNFRLNEKSKDIRTEIEVVWSNENETGVYRGMGVKFTRASVEDLTAIFEFIGEELLSDR